MRPPDLTADRLNLASCRFQSVLFRCPAVTWRRSHYHTNDVFPLLGRFRTLQSPTRGRAAVMPPPTGAAATRHSWPISLLVQNDSKLRLLGVLWVGCDLIVNRYGKLNNKGLVIPPWWIIQPTKRCGYRYRLSVQGVCTDISLDIKTKHLTETHVRPGAAGLLIDIECSKIRDSSWMYLTSLVKLPE